MCPGSVYSSVVKLVRMGMMVLRRGDVLVPEMPYSFFEMSRSDSSSRSMVDVFIFRKSRSWFPYSRISLNVLSLSINSPICVTSLLEQGEPAVFQMVLKGLIRSSL